MNVDNYLMYLRKSRADDPNETVAEVLEKHYDILQKLSIDKFGEPINENNIYREVVSGETIQERPEIQKVLRRMESDSILGVLVVDPQRLTRGDLIDCGTIINAFKYSHTLIICPTKTFDLSHTHEGINYDEKIFKMELNSGSEYLEYTKMILNRGRKLSVSKGNYIGSIAPYGYNRITIGKDYTLSINDIEAQAVKLIFKMYNDGNGYSKIATILDNMSYLPRNTKKWSSSVIKDILCNEVYIGKIRWNHRKEEKIIRNGIMNRIRNRQGNYDLFNGKHEAIISEETFYKAKDKMGKNPRINTDRKMINPLSSLMYCKKCKRAIIYRTYIKDGKIKSSPRYLCNNQKNCHVKSALASEIILSLIDVLEQMISDFEFKINDNNQTYIDAYQIMIDKLNNQLKEIENRQNELYDLLESKIYTRDVFIKRNDKLSLERKEAQDKLNKAILNAPDKIDYKEKIKQFKNVISLLKDNDIDAEIKNRFIKEIIDYIEYDNIDDKIILDVYLK